MDNRVILLVSLLVIICAGAQASETPSSSFYPDLQTTAETLASQIQNVTAYHDFAKKQLDEAPAHPRLALYIPEDSTLEEKNDCDDRKSRWTEAEKVFLEVLSLYENSEIAKGDDRLTYAFCLSELAVLYAMDYWHKKEGDPQARTPRVIMSGLLEAISDTSGSPAEYPGAVERLLNACKF